MDKRFWGFLIVIALILGGVFFISNTNKAGAPATSTKGVPTKHVEGSSPNSVTLVEYGDFQCPACGQYYEPVKQAAEKYNKHIVFQFRNFPLFQIHPNAIAAARAAEAADMQGKYWQMHDKLYEENVTSQLAQQQGKTYQTWVDAKDPVPLFGGYAAILGLNTKKFQQDYKSKAVNDRVQADLKEGNRLGVQSTPTFFLDGKKISNPEPTLDAFSKVIDAEIVKKGGTTPAETTEEAPLGSTDPND